jgi:hypothetical protein
MDLVTRPSDTTTRMPCVYCNRVTLKLPTDDYMEFQRALSPPGRTVSALLYSTLRCDAREGYTLFSAVDVRACRHRSF